MKTKLSITAIFLCSIVVFLSLSSLKSKQPSVQELIGAWKYGTPSNQTVLINSATAFAVTTYNLPGKKFISSYGGSWRLDGNTMVRKIEFNSANPDEVGKEIRVSIGLSGDKLTAGKEQFARLDNGRPGELAGAWIIIGNYKNDVLQKSPVIFKSRRTMKILSGTRFQWIAYDIDSKKLLNSGGGTYETSNGMYGESIEFFTKSPEGVGRRLEFEYTFDGDNWRHKGKSSTGGVVDECWVRRESLEK
ncbi:membrane or secreted protein [Mucilaginibacter limnophilus]|uniref:Membrane or secreted protein n=1 Tax=Mucilaginibacter limnophilus TaxID=1932778 RepID=A0A3S2Y0T4_9SPHI|nr:membrane or secreted protein [Mucilaginibacter limnophilus]RVT97282.1 membrane or secreted protein [Mucilaginibacter limnophilus]